GDASHRSRGRELVYERTSQFALQKPTARCQGGAGRSTAVDFERPVHAPRTLWDFDDTPNLVPGRAAASVARTIRAVVSGGNLLRRLPELLEWLRRQAPR